MLVRCLWAFALIIANLSAVAVAQVWVDSAGLVHLNTSSDLGCDPGLVNGVVLRFSDGLPPRSISAKKVLSNSKVKRSGFRLALIQVRETIAALTPPIDQSLLKRRAKLKKKLSQINKKIRFVKDCVAGAYYNQGSEPFVSLFYDQDGVPYIKSDSDNGAFYGLGYAHASLRLFQMNLHNLRARGRLAEFFGSRHPASAQVQAQTDLKSMDIEMRTMGIAPRMQQIFISLPEETKGFLSAFAEGVNAYVADQGGALPFTFEQFGVPFEPWSGVDVLITYASYALIFTGGHGGEVDALDDFNQDVVRLGYQDALIKWLNKAQIRDWESAIIQSNTQSLMSSLDGTNSLASNIPAHPKASHNWVVAGPFNLTGFPIMVGLPMVDLGWRFLVEANIEGATFRSHGAGFPGTIGFLVGYTDFGSWAVTALGADVADLFALTPSAEKESLSYILDGVTTPYSTRIEEIKIKDEQTLPLTVRESFFGPVVEERDGIPYALRHIALNPLSEGRIHPTQGLIEMMRSQNLDQIHQAATGFFYPSVHLIYASNEAPHGRIGYMPNAALPIRSESSPLKGVLPQDGSLKANDWVGIMARNDIPHLHDPLSGFIVTGNNLPTDADIYGYGAIGHSDRSFELNRKLSDLISENGVLSADQVVDLRMGCESTRVEYMRELVNYLVANFPGEIPLSDPDIASAVQYFNMWGGTFRSSEPYYPLISKIRGRSVTLFRKTSMAHEVYGGGEGGLVHFLRKFHDDPQSVITSEYRAEVIDWLFSKSLKLAWNETIASPQADPPGFGPEPEQWNALVNKKLTIKYHSDGIFETSLIKDHNIVTNELECFDAGTIRSQSGNFYTQVTYLGNIAQSETLYAVGVDENPFSEVFSNQLGRFESSNLRQSTLRLEAAQALCSSTLPGSRSCKLIDLGTSQ